MSGHITPDEFDVRDLMAATPLGSPDLASA